MSNSNVENRTVFTGDNLNVLRGMNSNSVDLIYLDPPFNSNKQYAAPVGSKAAGAAFRDAWTLDDVDKEEHGHLAFREPALYEIIRAAGTCHSDSMFSYLLYMGARLLELKRVLKPNGSILLHCDPTASHYLKVVMNSIWGRGRFRNEIVWGYRGMTSPKNRFRLLHDIILFYAGDGALFNPQYDPPTDFMQDKYDKGWHRTGRIVAGVLQNALVVYDASMPGVEERITDAKRRGWQIKDCTNLPRGSLMRDIWEIPVIGPRNKERTGHPTQKPLKLLRRIIRACSNEDDLVLDPFCGSGTTLIAAEDLGRRWVGIDISPRAVEVVNMRLREHLGLTSMFCHQSDQVPVRTDIPSTKLTQSQRELEKQRLFGEQDGRCNGCLDATKYYKMTTDRIIPGKDGGRYELGNLQLLCGFCNSLKGSRSQDWLKVELRKKGILLND